MAHTIARVAAPIVSLPTAAANPVMQHPRVGRLPGAVASLSVARRSRAAAERQGLAYNARSKDAPAFAGEAMVMAAFEFLERKTVAEHIQITQPADIGAYLRARLGAKDHEVFTVVFLDQKHRVIACEEMFRGTVSAATVYPREVARRALQLNASAVVLSHNHPSGDPTPSPADEIMTYQVEKVLGLIDVRMLDHIIVSRQGAYTMKGNRHV